MLGRDVVEQRHAEEEAVASGSRLAAVHDDRRALLGAALDVRRDLVAVLARHERAHLDAVFEAVADLDLGRRSLIASTSLSPASPTATTCEIAMQRSPAEP